MYFWVYSNVLVKLQVQSALPPLLNDVAGHNQWLSRQHVLQYKCVLRAAAAAWIANLFGLQQPPVQVNQHLIVQCRLMEAAREERGLGRYNTAVLQLLLFVRLLLVAFLYTAIAQHVSEAPTLQPPDSTSRYHTAV